MIDWYKLSSALANPSHVIVCVYAVLFAEVWNFLESMGLPLKLVIVLWFIEL